MRKFLVKVLRKLRNKENFKVKSLRSNLVLKMLERNNQKLTTLGSGYEVIYGQLTDLQEEGATVARGQVIGNVAKTTKYFSVEGDHVYLEILKDRTPVDLGCSRNRRA